MKKEKLTSAMNVRATGMKKMQTPQASCPTPSPTAIRIALQLFTLLVVILALALIIVLVTRTSKADSEVRRSIYIHDNGGGFFLRGKLVEDYAAMRVRYELYYNVSHAPAITSIVVRGPLAAASPDETAPITYALCGVPGSLVCDTLTLPGRLTGDLDTLEGGPVSPSAALPVMRDVRANPDLYYVQVEPEGWRAPLVYTLGPSM